MITIISGVPGAGKTALLTYFLIQRMVDNGLDDWLALKREIAQMEKGGFQNLDLPKQHHLCFADYSVKVNRRYQSYYVDGFRIGLPNPFFETQFIAPHSSVFLDESQRYYDSRQSKFLREEVYRWHQLHRHNDYNLFMVCQRLANIDLNIRGIAENFLIVDKIDVTENKYGQVVKIEWTVRKFTSCDCAESYMLAKERQENSSLGEKLTIKADFSVFDFYDSKGAKPVFYEGQYNKGFDYFTEDGYQFTLQSFVEFNNTHYYVAPKGYFKNAEYDKQILKNKGE